MIVSTLDRPSSDVVQWSQAAVRTISSVVDLSVSTVSPRRCWRSSPRRPPAWECPGPAHQCSVCPAYAASVASACAVRCLRPRCLTTSARWCSCYCDMQSSPSAQPTNTRGPRTTINWHPDIQQKWRDDAKKSREVDFIIPIIITITAWAMRVHATAALSLICKPV